MQWTVLKFHSKGTSKSFLSTFSVLSTWPFLSFKTFALPLPNGITYILVFISTCYALCMWVSEANWAVLRDVLNVIIAWYTHAIGVRKGRTIPPLRQSVENGSVGGLLHSAREELAHCYRCITPPPLPTSHKYVLAKPCVFRCTSVDLTFIIITSMPHNAPFDSWIIFKGRTSHLIHMEVDFRYPTTRLLLYKILHTHLSLP